MRRRPLLACGLTLLVAPVPAATAADTGTGGASAPPSGGGLTPSQPVRPVATSFTVASRSLAAGAPARFGFKVDGGARTVRVRIELTRLGAARSAPTVRLRLGYLRTGVRHTHVWTPAPGELPAGEYTVTLRAFDDTGRALRRTAGASGRDRLTVAVSAPPVPAVTGRFPVAGAYSLGGAESRFGAGRSGHLHQGQDIAAAEGTPVLAPLPGVVAFVDFQRKGAGHYVVLRGADGRDYVFMYLQAGSISAAEGDALAAGEPFARVGSTGGSSGPHLHFELWPEGWYSSPGSAPIDPLPQLQAWALAR